MPPHDQQGVFGCSRLLLLSEDDCHFDDDRLWNATAFTDEEQLSTITVSCFKLTKLLHCSTICCRVRSADSLSLFIRRIRISASCLDLRPHT